MNMHSIHTLRRQRGMSIVEILVAVTLSLILLAGVVQIFISTKTTYRMQDEISRMQENGRFALDFLARDVRMAGYTGCSTFGPVTNTLNEATSLTYNFSVGIEGYDVGATAPTYLTDAGINPTPNTDAVIVRRNADNPVRVTKNNSSAQVFVENQGFVAGGCPDGSDMGSDICEGDILMISDCLKSRVFQVANIQETSAGGAELNMTHPATGDPGNDITSWGGASGSEDEKFGEDAEIVKIETFAYFVADTDGDGIPSLYRKDGTAAPEELVDGIADMQVTYGVDSDGDRIANSYSDATGVADWTQVVSARVRMLVRSNENGMMPSPQGYTYNDTTVDSADMASNDRYLRHEVGSLITIRNRAM